MVGMAILSAIMTFVYQALHSTALEVRRAGADTASQQASLMTLQRLVGEVTYSDHRTVTFSDTAFSFLSTRQLNNTALSAIPSADLVQTTAQTSPVWEKFVFFYHEPDKRRVMRKEFPYPDGNILARIKVASFPSLQAVNSYPARRICDSILLFRPNQVGPRTFRLQIKAATRGGGREHSTNLSMMFTVRNGL
jgi:hypothetical protein